jgi:hypothetical protein
MSNPLSNNNFICNNLKGYVFCVNLMPSSHLFNSMCRRNFTYFEQFLLCTKAVIYLLGSVLEAKICKVSVMIECIKCKYKIEKMQQCSWDFIKYLCFWKC